MAKCVENVDKTLECPVCLDVFKKPIKQCVLGHSFCATCINPNNVKICPECRSEILDTRNYRLEELLDAIEISCENKSFGCPYLLSKNEMDKHILECKYRNFKCEGNKLCKWKCDWEGRDLLEHFKSKHAEHASMNFNTSRTVAFNDTSEFYDINIISAHYQLFCYKHKIDPQEKRAYWVIQFIGPHKQAEYYYYEFEISSTEDLTRKFKITEYCRSDNEDIQSIFASEKCVAISFAMLKNYVNKDNKYTFRFRLMKKPKPDKQENQKQTKTTEVKPQVKPVAPQVRTNRNYMDISSSVQYIPPLIPNFVGFPLMHSQRPPVPKPKPNKHYKPKQK